MSGDDDLDALAGDYVLGLLAGEERDRFERRMSADPAVRAVVDAWQERLMPLAATAPSMPPSPEVWQKLEATLGSRGVPRQRSAKARGRQGGWWHNLPLWRGWALGASLAAAALAAWIVAAPEPAPEPRLLAVLTAASGEPTWILTVPESGGVLRTRALMAAPDGPQVQELWLLPAGGGPISLGLLAGGQAVWRELPDDVAALVVPGAGLAVSLEPPGGAPGDRPTGPIVYTGRFIEDRS
jgi:anti-sigma-K factor RskA